MISRRRFLKMGLAAGAALAMPGRGKAVMNAFAQSPSKFTIQAVPAPYPGWPMQTLWAGKLLPQWKQPLPVLGNGIQVVAGDTGVPFELQMREFQYNVLPAGTVLPNKSKYAGTWVWGYRQPEQADGLTANSYIGPVILAKRNTETEIKFVNKLPATGAASNVLAYKYSIDQTLHWAAPTGMVMDPAGNMCMALPMGTLPAGECADTYKGPIAAVPHLHGGEVPALIDGGPDSWFTSDGAYHGKTYYSKYGDEGNACTYRYPNKQEAALIWFHDHTLGATRVNVYCGLAGAYLLTDPDNDPQNLPDAIPLVIQDRSFDVSGQFLLPAGPPNNPNPDHPYWVPEFVGDSILVNGKLWPYLNVDPKRYRFLIINGSNARTYEMFLTNQATKVNGPAMWQIGTDGGYLDKPVKIDPNGGKGQLLRLVMMPGERADIIVDFSGQAGQTLILKNVAKTPYPGGLAPDGNTVGKILQIRVSKNAVADTSFDPAAIPTPDLRPAGKKIVRLASALGQPVRMLTLNEIMGMAITTVDPVTGLTRAFPGGPLEILVNNTKWAGMPHMGSPRSDFVEDKVAWLSELPEEGATELWEIVNLTMDAHPIHLHLVQFQLLNRQAFDAAKYTAVYNAAFPGMMFMPAYGPPLDYNTGCPGKYGGNPDVAPFLKNAAMPPAPNELGWKDTVQCPPGMITRFLVRFAPTDLQPTDALVYPFDPGNQGGAGSDYVWHCHIIDHEDNEMMRPYTVKPVPGVDRVYKPGSDF